MVTSFGLVRSKPIHDNLAQHREGFSINSSSLPLFAEVEPSLFNNYEAENKENTKPCDRVKRQIDNFIVLLKKNKVEKVLEELISQHSDLESVDLEGMRMIYELALEQGHCQNAVRVIFIEVLKEAIISTSNLTIESLGDKFKELIYIVKLSLRENMWDKTLKSSSRPLKVKSPPLPKHPGKAAYIFHNKFKAQTPYHRF